MKPGHITGERAAAIDGMVRAASRTIDEGASLGEVWSTIGRMLEPFLADHAD